MLGILITRLGTTITFTFFALRFWLFVFNLTIILSLYHACYLSMLHVSHSIIILYFIWYCMPLTFLLMFSYYFYSNSKINSFILNAITCKSMFKIFELTISYILCSMLLIQIDLFNYWFHFHKFTIQFIFKC